MVIGLDVCGILLVIRVKYMVNVRNEDMEYFIFFLFFKGKININVFKIFIIIIGRKKLIK